MVKNWIRLLVQRFLSWSWRTSLLICSWRFTPWRSMFSCIVSWQIRKLTIHLANLARTQSHIACEKLVLIFAHWTAVSDTSTPTEEPIIFSLKEIKKHNDSYDFFLLQSSKQTNQRRRRSDLKPQSQAAARRKAIKVSNFKRGFFLSRSKGPLICLACCLETKVKSSLVYTPTIHKKRRRALRALFPAKSLKLRGLFLSD